MATTKDISNKALCSDSLVGSEKHVKKGKSKKPVALAGSSRMGSAEDFVAPKGSKTTKSVSAGGTASKGPVSVPSVPGLVARPYIFGQTNTFELPQGGTSTDGTVDKGLATAGPVHTGAGYIGFGLSKGVPPGTPWGDTPFPGSLAAARAMGDSGVPPLSPLVPGVEPPSADPHSLPSLGTSTVAGDVSTLPDRVMDSSVSQGTEDVVPPMPQVLPVGVLKTGDVGGSPSNRAVDLDSHKGDAMDVGALSGCKRKPERVRSRGKKVSKSNPESAVDSLSIANSSSDSDHTIVEDDTILASDSQCAQSTEELDSDGEVPPTEGIPLSLQYRPDSIIPGDKFASPAFSYDETGICPWLQRLTNIYLRYSDAPEGTIDDVHNYLRHISPAIQEMHVRLRKLEDMYSRLQKVESLASREDKAVQAQPLFTPTVVAPLFSVGAQGSVSSPVEVVPEKRTRRKPRRRNRPVGMAPLAVSPMVVPSKPVSSVPRIPASVGVPTLQLPPPPPAPGREGSRVALKPRPESPTVLIQPLGGSFDSSRALRTLLEEHIRPQQLGLTVLSCSPAAECGVLVTL
ncbi:hypothetical protein AVEN_228792-1 [Araneus ventricosus]|uniref:Uncharacterized protein n=1 Tax=Araneus ventricosus TaxID=182803 RepID=A0A4Y2KVK7_ARAVE|nr:hypothetical protein AVEN_228792-1 [Araneus ventricosus]